MTIDFLLRILISGLLCGLIGAERQLRAKDAGIRTHILVGIGSSIFMIVSKYGFNDVLHLEHVVLDPSRVAAQIVSGIGFLGAGIIMLQKQVIKGLTTAAGLWVAAAIGATIGSGLLEIGIYGAILTLIVLELSTHLSKRFLGKHYQIIIKVSAEHIPLIFNLLGSLQLKAEKIAIYQKNKDNSCCKVHLELTLPPKIAVEKLYHQLKALNGIQSIRIN